jgi:integrase
LTLAAYPEEWRDSIREAVPPGTQRQYAQIVHQHIVPRLGKIKLKDLRADHLQGVYNAMLDDGRRARTVRLLHAVLHRALRMALKQGIIMSNPADAVTRPRFRRKEMRTLTDTQVRSLLLVAKGSRYEALLWLAVSTGLPQGELLGLRWSDLDWRNHRLQVQRQLQRGKGTGLDFVQPKPAAGRRVVVLGEETIKKLRAQMALLQEERRQAGGNWVENDLIFPSSLGSGWDHRNLHKYYKRFLAKAGLPDFRFHDLRHSSATLALQAGINPKVVQERLGHSDISLTLGTYSHVLPSMQEEAAQKLEELLTPIDVSEDIKKLAERQAAYAEPRSGRR